MHFVVVTLDCVSERFLRVALEVIELTRHRTEAAHLPEQPLVNLGARALVGRIKLSGLAAEILQVRARLEDLNRFAARPIWINDRRHPVVRRDLEKAGIELLALGDVYRLEIVSEPALLEHD